MSAVGPLRARDRGLVGAGVVVVALLATALVLLVSDPHASSSAATRAASGSPSGSPSGSIDGCQPGTPTAQERAYVAEMQAHHEQAVEMVALLRAAPDVPFRVQNFADRLDVVQAGEVADMAAWTQAWDQELADGACGAEAADTGHGDGHMEMPGMLTDAQLARLGTLQGREAAREFVSLMIEHHEGAVTMSEPVVRSAGNAWVLSLSRHVIADQVSEIGAMRRMLADL